MKPQDIKKAIFDLLVLNLQSYGYRVHDDFIKCRTDDEYRLGVIEVGYLNPVKEPQAFQGEGCYKMQYNFGIRCLVKRKTREIAQSKCLDMIAECKKAIWTTSLNLGMNGIINKSLRFGEETVGMMEENEVAAETDIAEGLMRISVKAYELPAGFP